MRGSHRTLAIERDIEESFCLTQVGPDDEEPGERGDQSLGGLPVASCRGPVNRAAQIGPLLFEYVGPRVLLVAFEMWFGGLGQRSTERGVSITDRINLARVHQRLGRGFTDRFEQVIQHNGEIFVRLYQGAVNKLGEKVENPGGVEATSGGYVLGRVKGESACKHGQASQQVAF